MLDGFGMCCKVLEVLEGDKSVAKFLNVLDLNLLKSFEKIWKVLEGVGMCWKALQRERYSKVFIGVDLR